MKPFTFKDSDEYRKLDEYKSLKKDPEIKAFLKPPKKKRSFFNAENPGIKNRNVKNQIHIEI